MKFIFEFPLNCEILKLKSYRKIFFSSFYVQPISRVVNFQTYIRYIWKIKQKYDLHYFSKCEYKNVHGLMWEGIVRFVCISRFTLTKERSWYIYTFHIFSRANVGMQTTFIFVVITFRTLPAMFTRAASNRVTVCWSNDAFTFLRTIFTIMEFSALLTFLA
jgi:hypothetical protein